MIQSISHWFSRHPYTVTSVISIILAAFGWWVLGWGERHLGFLLLLYFIMALGIRLDEIARAIGGSGGHPGREPESVAAQLREIRLLLRQIQSGRDAPARPEDVAADPGTPGAPPE
jgi:hypothetical protein